MKYGIKQLEKHMEISFCPKLPDNTVMHEEDGKYLFIVPDKPDWVVGNVNTAKLLSLCDGTRSIKDILTILQEHQFRGEAEKILEQLMDNGFFQARETSGEDSIYLLNSFHLNMSPACNLKCIYCYAEERTKKDDAPLMLEQYYRLIDEVCAINANTTVTFTGGEPLLNKDTIAVARYCKQKNMPTFLLTNGTLINKDNIQDIVDNFDSIRISVDGATAAIHEQLRGKGSYQKTMAAIDLLTQYGRTPMLAMTVTRLNLADIENMAKKYGNNLTFQPLYQVGRGRDGNLGISGEEYYEALNNASHVEPYAQLTNKLLSMRNRGCEKCAIGDGEISVSPTGDVFPCHMLHVEKFRAGNIKELPFTEIYYNSDVLKQIRTLSVNTHPVCADCPIRLLCCGGC